MTLANLAVEQVQVLNPRHARFVSEYASTGNGTRSYKAVYGEALSDEAAAASAPHNHVGAVASKPAPAMEDFKKSRRVN